MNDSQFKELENKHVNQKYSFAFGFILVTIILGIEYTFCNYIIFNLPTIGTSVTNQTLISLLPLIAVQVLNNVVNIQLQGYYDTKFPDEFFSLPFKICFTVIKK